MNVSTRANERDSSELPCADLPALVVEAKRSSSTKSLIATLESLFKRGDSEAPGILANLYENGLHAVDGRTLIRPNAKLAIRYRKAAASLGNPTAMTEIADNLWRSKSARERKKAVDLYKAAARRGYATAAYNLALSWLNQGKHRRAVMWFRRASSLGDESAAIQLALATFHGLGVRRNPPGALRKLLALARDAIWISDFEREEALLFVASALREGWSVKRDEPASVAILREAAELGSDAAKGLLCDLGVA